jgi:hypothetical protein
VSEELLATLEQQMIHLSGELVPHQTGVGIVFNILQPHPDDPESDGGGGGSSSSKPISPTKSSTRALAREEFRVLSVDADGPSDQGLCKRGDKLVAVDGHVVDGKSWGQVHLLLLLLLLLLRILLLPGAFLSRQRLSRPRLEHLAPTQLDSTSRSVSSNQIMSSSFRRTGWYLRRRRRRGLIKYLKRHARLAVAWELFVAQVRPLVEGPIAEP